MSQYRRVTVDGGVYFFTVVTYQRRPLFADPHNVALLRAAFKHIQQTQPFHIDGIVVLPDHLHALWRLPPNDHDYSGRWREIKKYVSKRIGQAGKRPGERDFWQRRFWEHTIRDDDDWQGHLDYIHYNPVKHGLTASPAEWPYSSFQHAVRTGWYPADWGQTTAPTTIEHMQYE